MRDLAKWQVVSFMSRGLAMVLGIVQGALIFRILSQTEWGLKELALSIGAALGIYQHLGLASASTREIASAKNDSEIFKIFVTSVFVRYCVTVPLALGLYLSSGYVATKYPGLEFPLKLYAVSLLFQGFQSILNSVVAGTKRFKHLFVYQVVIAVVSVCLFVPLVYYFGVRGFFIAFLSLNIVSTVALSILAFRPLRSKLIFPSKDDFTRLLKDIFSLSLAIYFVKVVYVNWEKFGNNLLGIFVSMEAVALYGFAVVFAKKLMMISDSITDVNLPVLSEKFTNDINDFKKTFTANFNKVFSFIVLSAALVTYWAPQVVLLYGGKAKFLEYNESLRLMAPLVLAFVFYSLINIVKSSILVPAKLIKEMVLAFVLLFLTTGASFFVSFGILGNLYAMAWSMALGGLVSISYLCFSVKKRLKYTFMNHDHFLLIIQGFFISLLGMLEATWLKVILFFPFAGLLVWGFFISGFVTKGDLLAIRNKLPKLKKV